MTNFKHLGFFKEYYVGGKLIGSVNIENKDRETFGYFGRKKELLESDIMVGKKRIKTGSEVETMIYPLCGRVEVDLK